MSDSNLMKVREANAFVQVMSGAEAVRDLSEKERETYRSALDVLQTYFKSDAKDDDLKTTSSVTSDTGKIQEGAFPLR